MPALRLGVPRLNLTPAELAALTAYLYFLNFFDRPGDAARGKRLVSNKGCIKCHSVGGRGGKVGPALDKYGHYISPIFLATAMWNHGAKMAEKMRERQVARPQLTGPDIADILAYINEAAKGERRHFIHMLAGSPKRGAELFREKKCVVCHAVRGQGGTIGPDLAEKRLPKKASAVAAIMWNHAPKMWAKMAGREIPIPTFADNEMADVIAYLSYVVYSDEPGDPVRGQKVVRQKGCLHCHSIKGRGGEEGPDLAAAAAAEEEEVNSPIRLVTAIWNHAPKMEKTFKKEAIPWPNFTGTEMADLVAYIVAVQHE